MADAGRRAPTRPTQQRSELMLILQFIGYRTLFVMAAVGSLYFYSGYHNYLRGMPFLRSFSPYYAFRLHEANDLAAASVSAVQFAFFWVINQILDLWRFLIEQLVEFSEAHVNPFVQENPILGFILLASFGFVLSLSILYLFWLATNRMLLIAWGVSRKTLARTITQHREEQWDFDPKRKPSEEQLQTMTRNLERAVHRVPALNGLVPRNADISIRELASRNRDSESKFRAAIYVMGPIKGTGFDNSYELPLTLDQVKRICMRMGNAATYETMPMDLVILESKRGSKDWALYNQLEPIHLGRGYPIKVLEKVMLQNRAWFIWDSRVKKSTVGYGLR